MSWEEVGKKEIACPCGKGLISQVRYGDDWNRFEDGPVIIECEECKKKYQVESEYHSSYRPGHGDWTTYYLTPIEYPSYAGICENSIYGTVHNGIKQIPFDEYLIETFSLIDLKSAKAEYSEKRSSAKVTGAAMKICKEHKRWFHSVKATAILSKLEIAISKYDDYYGSFDQRIVVREQEKIERAEYQCEKRKYQIKLEL